LFGVIVSIKPDLLAVIRRMMAEPRLAAKWRGFLDVEALARTAPLCDMHQVDIEKAA
jgi:hypothetical protein